MWLSPSITHSCGPQNSFLWVPLPKWGWIWHIPISNHWTGVWVGLWAVGWDSPSTSSVLENPWRCRALFPNPFNLPEAPWAQRGKLRQSRQCSQAQPQHQIQALSIPKSFLVLCSSEQTYSLCSHYGFLTAMRQNNDISPSFYLTILHGIVAEGMDWAGRDGSNPSGKFLPSKCAEPLGK